jgi:hypothetical protein
MAYGDYLDNITQRCAGLLGDISAGYNFDCRRSRESVER